MRSIHEDDFAEYTCVSKNTIGQSEEYIELHRIEREEYEAATTTTPTPYIFFEEVQILRFSFRYWNVKSNAICYSSGTIWLLQKKKSLMNNLYKHILYRGLDTWSSELCPLVIFPKG